MYHRLVYEEMFGEIPDGFEVGHICKNRACCNPEHLQILDGTLHAIKTNEERYKDRNLQAKEYWKQHNCSGTELGRVFGVSWSGACRWIRDWKRNV